MWGDAATTEVIEVDGTAIPVATNLAAALRHAHTLAPEGQPKEDQCLASNPRTRTVWTDTISINWCNILERKAQIQLMRTIYQQAELVLC